MTKMLQIRNVPDDLHRELVRRARVRRQTLTDYLTAILEREVSVPLPEELFERIARRERVRLPVPPEEMIRREREERDRVMEERRHRSQ